MVLPHFNAQFALQPKGKYQVSVCLGTACYVKGSGAIFSKLEELLASLMENVPRMVGFLLIPAVV